MRVRYLLPILLLVPASITDASADDAKEWSMARRIYADTKANKVGDLLTVIIDEETEATKDAKSSSSKKVGRSGSLSFTHPSADAGVTSWTNATIPPWSVDAKRNFEGGGSLENKDKLVSKITANVTEVLPNGNLLIEGRRSVLIQDERMQVILTGTVRPADISRDNTVKSSSIADAAIKYVSTGPMIKNQKRGLFSALWNWLNPF